MKMKQLLSVSLATVILAGGVSTFSADKANAAVAAGTTYTETFHFAIYSDAEKYADGTYVVAGLLDSSVTYTKAGDTTLNGTNTSVWDMKSSTTTRPVNGYQTRQVASRHGVEPYLPDQKVLSYGPSTTVAGSSFNVNLTVGMPSVGWTTARSSVDVTDNSSMSNGYCKWTYDFPLGQTVSSNTYLMEPGMRVSNDTGMVKFQFRHYGYYYKNLSYAGTGDTGLVTREFTDRTS
ncbi:hypothetical protein [Paenibacillus kobensis]|uniref:hypothetical protein n=1 Tax=Paenibacillus kobensis TaxID=59841 RepID=UPI000FD75ABD|nr:hypothetical protein [Paenibacillus kobensis]